jgi:NAD(P)-dependent dehydrogenase (short-subunit alcohol dehydrogenase family)
LSRAISVVPGVVNRAANGLGGVDILVNSAAHQATFGDIGDISDEE